MHFLHDNFYLTTIFPVRSLSGTADWYVHHFVYKNDLSSVRICAMMKPMPSWWILRSNAMKEHICKQAEMIWFLLSTYSVENKVLGVIIDSYHDCSYCKKGKQAGIYVTRYSNARSTQVLRTTEVGAHTVLATIKLVLKAKKIHQTSTKTA